MPATDQAHDRQEENRYTGRWRFQFSIVTLLGLTALVAAGTWLTTATPSAFNGLIVLGVGVWFPLLVVGFHRLLRRGTGEDTRMHVSELREIERDYPAAAHARGKAVEFRRLVSEAPQCEGPSLFNDLAEALHQYGLALLATGDSDGAAPAFAESRAISQRLGLAGSSPP